MDCISKVERILNEKVVVEERLSYVKSVKGTVHDFTISLKRNGARVADFALHPMPGCCGICVSTAAYVNFPYRNRGIGTLLNLFRMERAKELGYSLLLCTDIAINTPQVRVLEKNGWQKVFKFRNARTGNDVNINIKSLL